jgi:hypothetical protein
MLTSSQRTAESSCAPMKAARRSSCSFRNALAIGTELCWLKSCRRIDQQAASPVSSFEVKRTLQSSAGAVDGVTFSGARTAACVCEVRVCKGAMLSVASELLLRAAGGSAFALHNADTWEPWHYAAWMGIVLAGKVACNAHDCIMHSCIVVQMQSNNMLR